MDTVLFEKIFREHFPGLVNYASRILRNDSLAEEVVQNVFVSLWQKREALSISVSSVSYIYKCVYNACLNTRVHQEMVERYRGALSLDLYFNYIVQTPQAELDLHSREIEKAVIAACEKLPEKTRRIFIMSRLQGLKNAEIAQKTGISIKTVENHINIASRKLRKELEWLLVMIWLYNQ